MEHGRMLGNKCRMGSHAVFGRARLRDRSACSDGTPVAVARAAPTPADRPTDQSTDRQSVNRSTGRPVSQATDLRVWLGHFRFCVVGRQRELRTAEPV
jgi:hypothetical protein